MPGALIVNPFDIDAVKHALLEAHRMPAAERRGRMGQMRDAVGESDVHGWASAFLRRLSRSRLRSVVGGSDRQLHPPAPLASGTES